MGVFKSDDNYIYLDIPYCEFYIPNYYFDSKLAETLSRGIKVFGLFNIGIFDASLKLKKISILNIPTRIEIETHDTEIRDVDMGNGDVESCTVVKYYNGQKIMNASVIEDSSNAEEYLYLITKGKVPDNIPYDKTLDVWRKNQELNSVNFGVPSMVLEMILAVAYRDKDNLEKKFATRAGSDLNIGMLDYKMANIRQICQYASTFTAMTFEDVNSMITTSVNRSRENREEMESPVEQVIKF